MDPVATTGLYTAMLRARESARSDRLFSDPFAEALAGPQGNEVLTWMETRSPGVSENPIVAIRTRFFDDVLQHTVSECGVDQLVVLAAGLDTRAFRLPLPPDLVLFELDRPEVLDFKAARLAQLGAIPCCQRIPIPGDLAGDWPAALQASGFNREQPTAWLVEGLLQYLTKTHVHQLLDTLSGLAVPGSWLFTDLVSHTFFTSPQLAGFLAMMAANGSPWQFGTDNPEGLVATHGWRAQVTRFGEDGASFGRWIMPADYRDDPESPHGYLIVAQR
jgi:methyltransferase (TIGR00027 family)